MKWVKPFAIGYEYVCIPDKVNNLSAVRLLTLSAMIYICIGHATIYCHSRYSMTANMKTPQTRFITLSAMKVTNTDHTATNGNHSKCRMAPFSCALCAFARVLSRRCLLLIALYISRQAAKVAKIICNTK